MTDTSTIPEPEEREISLEGWPREFTSEDGKMKIIFDGPPRLNPEAAAVLAHMLRERLVRQAAQTMGP